MSAGTGARAAAAAFGCGLLFGLGLIVSGMTNPAKVIGFLDVAGDWDPSLALVMGAALVVTSIGYRLVWRRQAPWAGTGFQLPAPRGVDARLAVGAAMFGIGWGLAGLCPGPAITALGAGRASVYAFFAAMLGGMTLFRLHARVEGRVGSRRTDEAHRSTS